MSEEKRLDAILDTLSQVLKRLPDPNKPGEVDSRRHFYHMFNREANEYDKDFLKKYHDDLNTSLIFAGLFSAVAAAFIVDIQQEFRPNYNAMNFAVLTMMLNTTAHYWDTSAGIPTQFDPPTPPPPKPSVIQAQSILFAALTSALLAAFLAMLGKQWLNFYIEGSLVDRSRHRELRMRGMITWRFKYFLEILPLFLQLSLFLLGFALAQYTFDINRTISNVIASIAAFGVLFYLVIVAAATIWKECPFQTLPSRILRWTISSARDTEFPRLRDFKRKLHRIVPPWKSSTPTTTAIQMTPSGKSAGGPPASQPTVLICLEEDEGSHVSDTNCISTMFRFASGPDAIEAVTGFILDVNWTWNVQRVPIFEVFWSLRRSFEVLKDKRALVRPGLRRQACSSAKALLYLCIQRSCVGFMDSRRVIAAPLESLLVGYQFDGDHELASTLRVLDVVFNGDKAKDIQWEEFVLNDSHYCWLSHIIRCRAWLVIRAKGTLTNDITGFIAHSFSKDLDALPPRVMADCLLIISMVIGGASDFNETMLIKDKSGETEDVVRQIYQDIGTILGPYSSDQETNRAIEALKLLKPLKQGMLCGESYKLFRVVLARARSEPKLWEPVELLMSGAFKWRMIPPKVGDPADIVYLLKHYLSKKEDLIRDEPVECIMLALGGTSVEELSDGLAGIDFAGPPFLNGICRALRDDAPYLLRRATVCFLRHLDTYIFGTNTSLTKQAPTLLVTGLAPKLVMGWSISARETWDKNPSPVLGEALVTTFMGLLGSPFWRVHLPDERWDILRLISTLGGKLPRSFQRCLENTEIIPYLHGLCGKGRGTVNFTRWLAALWMKYPDLSDEVKKQLREKTQARPASEIPVYLSLLDGEIERDRKRTGAYGGSWSLEGELVKLKARHTTLQSARKILAKMQKPSPTT